MGTMGSVDLDLMNRLIRILSKTSHKYIVSKGPKHAVITLPRNMWGDRYVPQLKILPLVDLVITHGGNNTVCETFSQGKPMLVLPLFADQYDSYARIAETGFGLGLDPYAFQDQELIDSVERLLGDKALQDKLKVASDRILASKKHEELIELIESLMNV